MENGGWTGDDTYTEIKEWSKKMQEGGVEKRLAWLKQIAGAPKERRDWINKIESYVKESRKKHVKGTHETTRAVEAFDHVQDYREVVRKEIETEARMPDLWRGFNSHFGLCHRHPASGAMIKKDGYTIYTTIYDPSTTAIKPFLAQP